MTCSVCHGSGMVQLTHFPSYGGGWVDEKYTSSGLECGACHGTGVVPDLELSPELWKIPHASPEEEIGSVLHYYPRPQVAQISLTSYLRVGEVVHFKGATTDFVTTVESLRKDRLPVEVASVGDQVSIQVGRRVRKRDKVYRVG